jgi:hypothetical protein
LCDAELAYATPTPETPQNPLSRPIGSAVCFDGVLAAGKLKA